MLDFSASLLDQVTIPANIDFPVKFEKTKVPSKKYVINGNTGEYLETVGSTFKCASHGEFFRNVLTTVENNLDASALVDVKANWKTALNGGFAMLDLQLPKMNVAIEQEKIQSTIGNRIIALHGIDGSCSNQTYFGAIDFFCTNGMILGDHSKVKRKNTAAFSLDAFISELRQCRNDFYDNAARFQTWANTSLKGLDIGALLEKLCNSKKQAEKMFLLFQDETEKRGFNKFALYSAFTNYASYADERNGFELRPTKNDTVALSMWRRENDVNKWVSNPLFIEAGVAA